MQNPEPTTTTSHRPPARNFSKDRRAAPKHFSWTSDEYYRVAELGVFEGKRVELIEGEIIDMAPMGTHHFVCTNLVADALREIFVKGFFVSTQNQLDVDEQSQPEPDVAVVKGSPRDYLGFHPRTLVLAVEVSDTSLSLDRDIKTRLYAKAGIGDYWFVNLQDRCIEVFRKPTEDPNIGFMYAERTVFGEGQLVSPLAKPRSKVKVSDILP